VEGSSKCDEHDFRLLGCGSCPVADLGVSSVGLSGCAVTVLVKNI
jgi:hypothetical protein